jgi:hypothetical protein
LAAAIACLVFASSAWAAQDKAGAAGAGSLTTKQWVLDKAGVIAAAGGANWLDPAIAGASLSEQEAALDKNRSFAAGRWSKTKIRGAATDVSEDYALVVEALQAGDTSLASTRFGVLTLAFADLCDPLQTDNCRAESAELHGRTLRTRYELRVTRALNSARANRVNCAADGLAASGVAGTIMRYAAGTAVAAHHDYRRLVRGYRRHGFSVRVQWITRRDVRRSVAGLASMIVQASKDDPQPSPDPTPTPTPTDTPTSVPSPTPTTTVTPCPTPTPSPSATNEVDVPSSATQAQIDACVARAVADGHGTSVVFPAGKFAYSGTFIVPDYINISGQGIWDQGATNGAGGTWLQCTRGLRWGSYSTIKDLLVGQNTAGLTCSFSPVPRGSSAAGAFTAAHGSHSCTFSFVRFKGGSDAGASLIDLGGNFGSGLWSAPVKTDDMIDTNWYDCEFERPQVANPTTGTSGGAILNIWLDCRQGGAQVYGNGWYRCHFGVKNGYHSGIDGYGIGQTILFQPAPAEHASDGPRPTGQPDNMNFDWSQVGHDFSDNHFEDCLFEYAFWCPMDICDYARSYSLTNRFAGVVGSNPPTAAQAAAIPDQMWNEGLSMTRCYFKGSYPAAHSVVGEEGKDCVVKDSTCSSGSGFAIHAGSYGNLVSGVFSNANRPFTPIFTTDSTGSGTSYTPSPYDP